MFTIPNHPMLAIAPDVVALLGSPAAVLRVINIARSGYVCTVCASPARLTDTDRAAVLVLAFPDAPHVVRLAHGDCADSCILAMTDDPDINPGADPAILFPAMAWLRPPETDPAAVLVVAPHLCGLRIAGNGDVIDTLTANLLAYGFGLLTHPEAPMPDLDAVTGHLDRHATLTLLSVGDELLWSGHVDPPHGWATTARTTGRIGVAFAAGIAIHDGDRDRVADLFTAIGDGRAVAASVQLDTDTDTDTEPA